MTNNELREALVDYGVLEDNGGLRHCHRCECEMTTKDDIE